MAHALIDKKREIMSPTPAQSGRKRETSAQSEKAAQDLPGGLASCFEGLRDSRCPCKRVLSVVGFFASLGPVPGPGRVYSERKEASFSFPGSFPSSTSRE